MTPEKFKEKLKKAVSDNREDFEKEHTEDIENLNPDSETETENTEKQKSVET